MVANADVGPRHVGLLRAAGASIIGIALACLLALPVSPMCVALAEDIDIDPAADKFQLEVERTAAAYDEAVSAADEAGRLLEENAERVAELEKLIPVQQARSEMAARELYKFEQQRLGFLDLMLGSDSFFELLSYYECVNRVTEAHCAEIRRLSDLKSQLSSERAELEQAKSDADERAADAQRALSAAQEARLEAQRKAAEAARQMAEANAAARASAGDGAGSANTAQPSGASSTSDAASSEEVEETPVNDAADWTSDKASFVSSWAARIDAYLAGSPLSGMGTAFARAAWDYGVDPRWSPAIAYTESSLGAYCFLPHNAWGWGSASWDSWEEAIDAHVRGLARGYGYTISIDAAKKYCPPNSEHWYNVTLAQMNQI